LNLTDVQVNQIKAIEREVGAKKVAVTQAVRKIAPRGSDRLKPYVERMTVVMKEAFAQVIRLFDDDQKKAWNELTGEPFEVLPTPLGGVR
jgi:hypothetical protein